MSNANYLINFPRFNSKDEKHLLTRTIYIYVYIKEWIIMKITVQRGVIASNLGR